MEVRCNEKLIAKAIKQALANMKIEEIDFTNEQIHKIEQKIKTKLLERSN